MIVVGYKGGVAVLTENIASLKEFVSGFGVYGPIILALLVIISMVVVFLPLTPLIMAAGYLFGVEIGRAHV